MKLTVLGPGCWGLTLAWLMNDNFEDIVIWGRECDLNDDLVFWVMVRWKCRACRWNDSGGQRDIFGI